MVYAADKFVRDFLGLSRLTKNPALLADPNHEDPSYPIFHLRFLFDVPEKNHPDYVSNNLLLPRTDPNSAVKYLESHGEPERAEMLSTFIDQIREVSTKTPWYFQDISGLDSLYSHGYGDMSSKSYYGSNQSEAKITIQTLDSIDFKMHFFKDLYRKAAYDRRFKRWILPVNLRRFRMQILVGDFRKFKINEDNFSANPRQIIDTLRDTDIFNAPNSGGKILGAINDGSIQFTKRLQWWDGHFSCMVFDCQDCEFDMTEFNHGALGHSNIGSKSLSTKFTVKIGKVIEANTYSLLDYVLSDEMFSNIIKDKPVGHLKNTGLSAAEEVAKLSKAQENIFKPTISAWNNYQALEREKGDNKRILLENRDVESALNSVVNDVAGMGLIGESVQNILGGNSNAFGNVAGDAGILDFAADTASELIQDALGLGTEQIVKNIFSNEVSGSIAGAALGVLNGDLNSVAQNLTNPALLGQLGIKTNDGANVPKNVAAGIPKNINLTGANVQRSLSDINAQLAGEGGDPRFRPISRPGESLFTNPAPGNSLLDPKNVELQAPRVSMDMPKNVNLQETRKENELNPKNADLTGAKPKDALDESSVNLIGAGKQSSFNERNTNLSGATPLSTLNPKNAELIGASSLNELIPNNAELNGAGALSNMPNNNAELIGAGALDKLNPTNAELIGAGALDRLNPINVDLTGAKPLDTINPINADLNGSGAIDRMIPTNVELTGSQSSLGVNIGQIDLIGATPIKDLQPTNVKLEGSSPLNRFVNDTEDLKGVKKIEDMPSQSIDFDKPRESNIKLGSEELLGAPSITNLGVKTIDFNEADKKRINDLGKETLESSGAIRNMEVTNADLRGAEPIRSLDQTSEKLNGGDKMTNLPEFNANLKGSQTINTPPSKNVNLSGVESNVDMGTNVQLTGSDSQISFGTKNANLEGKQPQTTMSKNMNFDPGTNNKSELGNIHLDGNDPITTMKPSSIDLNQPEKPVKNSLGNVHLGVINSSASLNLGNTFSDRGSIDENPDRSSLGSVNY